MRVLDEGNPGVMNADVVADAMRQAIKLTDFMFRWYSILAVQGMDERTVLSDKVVDSTNKKDRCSLRGNC